MSSENMSSLLCLFCYASVGINKITKHVNDEHDVFFNKELITAVNFLEKDTIEEIVKEFDKNYSFDKDSVNAVDKTVPCLLCNGRISLIKNGKQKFVNHIKGEHGIFFNHDLVMAINFIDKDTKNDIIKRCPKVGFSKINKRKAPAEKVSDSDIDMLLMDDPDDPDEIASEDEDNSDKVPISNKSTILNPPKKPKMDSFKCQQCEKAFLHKESLTKHTQTAHPENIQYNCEVCKKSFINEHFLNNHKKNCTPKPVFTPKPFQPIQTNVQPTSRPNQKYGQTISRPNQKYFNPRPAVSHFPKKSSNIFSSEENNDLLLMDDPDDPDEITSEENNDVTRNDLKGDESLDVATNCPVCNRFYSTIELFAKHIFSGIHGLDITLSDKMKSKLEAVYQSQNNTEKLNAKLRNSYEPPRKAPLVRGRPKYVGQHSVDLTQSDIKTVVVDSD